MLDKPQDRLTTSDESGKRLFVYPAEVSGYFKNLRQYSRIILIFIFLSLPWLRINGKPVILLDVAERKFFLFGFLFRATDAPYIFFLLLIFALTIAFVTAIWGRIWCAWACPQTVFVEGVFRKIEELVEGKARQRKEIASQPLNGKRIFQLGLKYFLYLCAALIITHSFLAYFVGTEKLSIMIRHSPAENITSFLVIVFATAIILFDFAWFREQFCVIMCPYGRFQSVLMDSHSTIVAYDSARGEPRRNFKIKQDKIGDCVDCNRCIQVCPTGIDIRRGVQMECIACTACIDACDEVMHKINKPSGLIKYTSLTQLAGKHKRIFRGRTYIYFVLIFTALMVFTLLLQKKNFIDTTILRAKDGGLYQVVSENNTEWVINHFKLEVANDTSENIEVFSSVSDNKFPSAILIMPINPNQLKSGEYKRMDFFIKLKTSDMPTGSGKMLVTLKYNNGVSKNEEVSLIGPIK